MKIVLLGATGLVGNDILKKLIRYKIKSKKEVELIAPTRSKLSDRHIQNPIGQDIPALLTNEVTNKTSVVICALGSTLKKAGSKEAFKAVDRDLIFNCIKNFPTDARVIIISSLGADKDSFFFYNKVKGELESKLKELKINELCFIRPSLLIGKRQNDERFLEELSQFVLKPFTLIDKIIPSDLKQYTPHKKEDVADMALELALNFEDKNKQRLFYQGALNSIEFEMTKSE